MNGSQALLRTLVANGVRVCFANPGTSEMHFVAALDSVPEMRACLGLFEGVVSGAADGYARMTDAPAATLLHLGPGQGNALANLHNARRAKSPIVNIVGDHATDHLPYDAPLTSDIASVSETFSGWVRRCAGIEDLGRDAAEAVVASFGPPGQISTLILPAEVTWSDGASPQPMLPRPARNSADENVVAEVASLLERGSAVGILLGGRATRAEGLALADVASRSTGARVLCETFPARLQRGAGLAAVERLQYLGEAATQQLQDLEHLVLVEAAAPVTSFAHPGRSGDLVPPGCVVHVLADDATDGTAALRSLVDRVPSPLPPAVADLIRPELPSGALTPAAVGAAIGACLPEAAIVVDEGMTSGAPTMRATANVLGHDWLTLTGGSIGMGLPASVGAAIACPDRPVVCLQADGSAMYTIQALWTMARENLDVTVVIFNNRAYAILEMELARVGATAGPSAQDLLHIGRPDIGFAALGAGMGVPAESPRTSEELVGALRRAFRTSGPYLIDVSL